MLTAPGHEQLSPDEARVREWRLEQFRQLGFTSLQARLLAASPHVDLGEVRRIVAAGCEPGLALRIVL